MLWIFRILHTNTHIFLAFYTHTFTQKNLDVLLCIYIYIYVGSMDVRYRHFVRASCRSNFAQSMRLPVSILLNITVFGYAVG